MRLLSILALLVAASATAATPVPAPAVDPAARGLQTAVLAGGCFWGMEAVFEHVNGVRSVVSGYAGATGPAEAVRISYDPSQVSYGDLLRIYFAVAHDPTQLNRQGPDVGPSYRSAIFPQNDAQRQVAKSYLAQLAQTKLYNKPIVTRIETGAFSPAASYHQDFMRKNPRHPYILAHDIPKLAALKRVFPASFRN